MNDLLFITSFFYSAQQSCEIWEVAEDQKHGCNTSDEVTEPIRCCNQSPKLIPVWTEHAISFIVSCIWTLDPQLVLLFGKALVTWKGRASLEVLGHCGEALEGFYFNPTSRLFYASCQQI